MNHGTLTMTSSTITEPLSGWLAWVLVSKATEQGLNTCLKEKLMRLKAGVGPAGESVLLCRSGVFQLRKERYIKYFCS